VPTPSDYDDGEIGGTMIGRGNPSTRRKPPPVPLWPPQTPHVLPGREPGPTQAGNLCGTVAYVIPIIQSRDQNEILAYGLDERGSVTVTSCFCVTGCDGDMSRR
jgi:hypothetical protein